ncbi:MAG: ZIP family metal transporter [Erysipelotrichaceae bacterium]|nr:ZIP family metal transporter [Erysipelotrichaceae bacterium]
MKSSIILGIMFPFIGTTLGSACVFFMKDDMKPLVQKILLGFASGVMVAASVWSLLIPSIEMTDSQLSFIPAATGFLLGMGFLLILDKTVPHMHLDHQAEGHKSTLSNTTMMILAVTMHNLPEGMAVGIVYAGSMMHNAEISMAGALALSLGIAIQNFPEGAIISMPLKSEGVSSTKSFIYGMLSGAVEPIGALLTMMLSSLILPVLPYLLSFAAGAMLYVVVEELIPEGSVGEHSNIATIGFALGFVLMMILDVALG